MSVSSVCYFVLRPAFFSLCSLSLSLLPAGVRRATTDCAVTSLSPRRTQSCQIQVRPNYFLFSFPNFHLLMVFVKLQSPEPHWYIAVSEHLWIQVCLIMWNAVLISAGLPTKAAKKQLPGTKIYPATATTPIYSQVWPKVVATQSWFFFLSYLK